MKIGRRGKEEEGTPYIWIPGFIGKLALSRKIKCHIQYLKFYLKFYFLTYNLYEVKSHPTKNWPLLHISHECYIYNIFTLYLTCTKNNLLWICVFTVPTWCIIPSPHAPAIARETPSKLHWQIKKSITNFPLPQIFENSTNQNITTE